MDDVIVAAICDADTATFGKAVQAVQQVQLSQAAARLYLPALRSAPAEAPVKRARRKVQK